MSVATEIRLQAGPPLSGVEILNPNDWRNLW